MNQRAWGASVLCEDKSIVFERRVIGLVDQNPKEGGGFVRLKLSVDRYDECGCNGRKQTSLFL